jgi:hypothetical protein
MALSRVNGGKGGRGVIISPLGKFLLNDDDGTLTGLVGAVQASKQPSISINEDPFFDAALTTPECLSGVNVKPPPPPLPKGTPVTARTGQGTIFSATKADFCRPKSYCSYNQTTKTCGCNADNRDCDPKANDCAWAVNDIDCPVDLKNLNSMQCFGFSFTLPENFTPTPKAPPANLFVPFNGATNSPPYFEKDNVTFQKGLSISPDDMCAYNPVPMQ